MGDLEKPLEGLHQAMKENSGGEPSGADKDLDYASGRLSLKCQPQTIARMDQV